ncbi:hypothetical protein KOI35_11725 [Actinoplanes bogorensis]|uniref:Uncharacterized protein n=1 Tax=Paractinoplanes bogorensis TaxID=1610840 RepID=A0ABS5YL48_9ACTN|nr:hypothetical protein [Actinoplanes bogorensis]MBU2664162.1 hypothetical protein [Actinoplanes bogorensis]
MTVTSLVTAVAVGAALGVAGWTARRGVPFWLPPAAGVGAAVFATVITRIVADLRSGFSVTELVLQVFFAGAAVTAVVATADRRTPAASHSSPAASHNSPAASHKEVR